MLNKHVRLLTRLYGILIKEIFMQLTVKGNQSLVALAKVSPTPIVWYIITIVYGTTMYICICYNLRYYYHIAGNFRRVKFSQIGIIILTFRGSISQMYHYMNTYFVGLSFAL